jgi:hypothetical protein
MELKEDLEINPGIYSHLFLTNEPKVYIVEKLATLTNGAGKTGYPQIEN